MTHSTRNMVRAALFSGAMAVCAWLAVPVSDIGFTMQTFGVFLALGLLGGKWGTVSIGIYLLMGLVGLPVFSGFHGGFGAFLGATGGFIWGLLLASLLFWGITALIGEKFRLVAVIIGLITCYLCGAVWFSHVYTGSENPFLIKRCINSPSGIMPYAFTPPLYYICPYYITKHATMQLS